MLANLEPKIGLLRKHLGRLRANPHVRDVRQCGFIAGIELGGPGGAVLDPIQRTGARVCLAARNHGLLPRPILDTIVLMLPLCATEEELDRACTAIERAIADVVMQ